MERKEIAIAKLGVAQSLPGIALKKELQKELQKAEKSHEKTYGRAGRINKSNSRKLKIRLQTGAIAS